MTDAAASTFQQLYEAELAYVWATLRRLGVRGTDLNDLTHDVFVIAYSRLRELDPTRPVRPWLFGIAFRVVVGFKRRARTAAANVASGAEPEALPATGAGPEEAVAAGQDRQLVAAALEAVDLDRRTVLVMHEIDGHPVPEIARALEIPLNTAYSRLRLARRDFVEAVRRIQGRGGTR